MDWKYYCCDSDHCRDYTDIMALAKSILNNYY